MMIFLLVCFLLLNAHTIATSCSKRLGGVSEKVEFSCGSSSAVSWKRNGVGVNLLDEEKYQLNSRTLTVTDIVGSDEGNYTCTFDQETHFAGCLLVYGAAKFRDTNWEIMVSRMGTVVFDLSLSFTQSGPSMNTQYVTQYSLKNGSRTIVNCQSSRCSFYDTDEDHWWAVENGSVFILHQAKSSDRGTYTESEVEVRHPKDNSLYSLKKDFHVTSSACKEPYPSIENGYVSTLESAENINGSQANYSCSDGCELQGSPSLRCQNLVIDYIETSQWVNETGQNDAPSCLCSTIDVTPTLISIEISKSEDSVGQNTTPSTGFTHPPKAGVGASLDRITTLSLVLVPVGVLTALAVLAVATGIFVCKRRHRVKKFDQKVEESLGDPEVDDQNTDSPENLSVSHISHSDQDDNISQQEDIPEIPGSHKNSDAFQI